MRPVPDDHDQRQLDAELVQAIGEPRAVAVADPARQHLGAGHHYPGARAHVQVGSWPRRSGRRPAALVIV